jgi:hypothetical protein
VALLFGADTATGIHDITRGNCLRRHGGFTLMLKLGWLGHAAAVFPALFAGETMRRVLLVGYDPDTVDFSDPALPPGMTAAKIHAGVQVALKQMADRGWEADVCFIRPDQTAGPTVERQLAAKPYECVVVGAGVRLPPKRLAIFEAVINAIHKAAPTAVIAFNTRPDDSADAAGRWLPPGHQG